jgi:NTE family protein
MAPVTSGEHPVEDSTGPPATRIGLCLSGGGFRAMLFHAGVVWRLSELGLLRRVHVISGVSGGSIAAAMLGLSWSELDFDGDPDAALRRHFVDPLRHLADRTVDYWSLAKVLIDPRHSAGEHAAAALSRYLFGERTLQDLPDQPTVVINAANVQSLAAWRFSKLSAGDERVGSIEKPAIAIATAVAASAAYSPFISPVRLRLREGELRPRAGSDLRVPPYTTRVTLADASSIDSLGIGPAWETCGTVLISDALKPGPPLPRPPKAWVGALQRTRSILESQMRAVNVRAARAGFRDGTRAGAYWEIGDPSALAEVPGALDCPPAWASRMPQIRTRLGKLSRETQEQLINWGYAIADASLRGSFDSTLTAPSAFPYPGARGRA